MLRCGDNCEPLNVVFMLCFWTQFFGMQVKFQGLDFMTIVGHKFGAPKVRMSTSLFLGLCRQGSIRMPQDSDPLFIINFL